jgi:hypothetical protein
MTTISVICITVDTDGTESIEALYTGKLTPRRLARAYKIALENRAYFKKHFGNLIAPRFTTELVINDSRDSSEEIAWALLPSKHNKTWTEICARIEKYAQLRSMNV